MPFSWDFFTSKQQVITFIHVSKLCIATNSLHLQYHIFARLRGTNGPINCLSLTRDGTLLASGGMYADPYQMCSRYSCYNITGSWWSSLAHLEYSREATPSNNSRQVRPLGASDLPEMVINKFAWRENYLFWYGKGPHSCLSRRQGLGKWTRTFTFIFMIVQLIFLSRPAGELPRTIHDKCIFYWWPCRIRRLRPCKESPGRFKSPWQNQNVRFW